MSMCAFSVLDGEFREFTSKMSDLPVNRIESAIAFSNDGLDYTGRIPIRDHKHRNPNKTKAYITMFVYFATKLCYIELVSDHSCPCFIALLPGEADRLTWIPTTVPTLLELLAKSRRYSIFLKTIKFKTRHQLTCSSHG